MVQINSRGASAPIIMGVIAILAVIGGVIFFSNQPAPVANTTPETDSSTTADISSSEGSDSTQAVETAPPATTAQGESAPNSEIESGSSAPVESTTVPKTPGKYTEYEPSLLSNAVTGDVVLFFTSPICGSCRALEGSILSNESAIPAGLSILKVDFQSATELKAKYGVTFEHTFVQVDANGSMIKKWFYSPTLSILTQNVE